MITREPRACASGYGVAAFALDGAEVAEVNEEPGRGRTVWLVMADPAARMCPVCKTASEHVREQVVTRPARQAFAQSGYDRATIRAIAAGVNPGLVMHYFGSKEDLFRRAASMAAGTPEPDTPEQLAELLLGSLGFKLDSLPLASAAALRCAPCSPIPRPPKTSGP